MSAPALRANDVLAAVDPERVTPGLLGFAVVVCLGLATWGLLRSMTRQLKKVDFAEEPPPGAGEPPGAEDPRP